MNEREEKEKKDFRSIFEELMKEKVTDEIRESLNGYISKRGKKVSAYEAMAMVQLKKALDGDVKAFELIRDTLGQKGGGNNIPNGIVRVMLDDE